MGIGWRHTQGPVGDESSGPAVHTQGRGLGAVKAGFLKQGTSQSALSQQTAVKREGLYRTQTHWASLGMDDICSL